MANWEKFELACTDYLNKTFGSWASFAHMGGSNSTVSDIEATTRTGRVFYLDAKHCPAQCGQFVLHANSLTKRFEYSPLNDTNKNHYAAMIMDYMDANFDDFKDAGTSGKDIIMPNGPAVFADWIIHTYKNKGAEFFITNNFTLVPIELFLDFFTVTAKYRVKRSGSSHVGKNNQAFVCRYIQNNGYNISKIRIDGGKVFVSTTKEIQNPRFMLNGIEYMFSMRGEEYEIRKLSNTFNANVIFSINLKNTQFGISNSDFIRHLKQP